MDGKRGQGTEIPLSDLRMLESAPVSVEFRKVLGDGRIANEPSPISPRSMPLGAGPPVCGCPDGPGTANRAGEACAWVGRGALTLADFSLDTRGLDDWADPGMLAGASIANLVRGSYPPFPYPSRESADDEDPGGDEGDRIGESCLCGPEWDGDEDGEDDGDFGGEPTPGGERRKPDCNEEAKFLNVRSGGRRSCDDIDTAKLNPKRSIAIYWVVEGSLWDPNEAAKRLKEASTWFDENYCIELDLRELDIDKEIADLSSERKRKAASDSLTPARKSLDADCRLKGGAYLNSVIRLYKRIWLHLLGGKKRKFLLVLFVDEYQEMQGDPDGKRPGGKVSTNLTYYPVITITSAQNIAHIVTHELVHGLGKIWGYDAAGAKYRGLPKTQPYGPDSERGYTWEHGGGQQSCENDMGNAKNIRGTNLLDAAAYKTFLARKTIFAVK